MRELVEFDRQQDAENLHNILFVKDIENHFIDDDNKWVVWVHDEDQLREAKDVLSDYVQGRYENYNYEYAASANKEKNRLKKEKKKEAKMYKTRSQIFQSNFMSSMGVATKVLIIISVVVLLLQLMGANIYQYLFFSIYNFPIEIINGQIWRLLTPIFMHQYTGTLWILHIFFNMWWLKDLGTAIELTQGTKHFLLLVFIIALVSNVAQAFILLPAFQIRFNGRFLGMSGVVFGLLGYIWMRSKYNTSSGLFMNPSIMQFMIIYLVVTMIFFPRIAHTAHIFGLLSGVALGYLFRNKR